MDVKDVAEHIMSQETETLTNSDLKRIMRIRRFCQTKREGMRKYYLPLAAASFMLVLLLFALLIPPIRISFMSVLLAFMGAVAAAYVVPGLFGGVFAGSMIQKARKDLVSQLAHEHATSKAEETTHSILYGIHLSFNDVKKAVFRPFPVRWHDGQGMVDGFVVFFPGAFRVYATGKCGMVYANEFTYRAEGTDDYPLHSEPAKYEVSRGPNLEKVALAGGNGSTVILSDKSWGRMVELRWIDISRLPLKGRPDDSTYGNIIAQVYLPKNRTGQAEFMYVDHDGKSQTRYVDMDRFTVTSLDSAKKES